MTTFNCDWCGFAFAPVDPDCPQDAHGNIVCQDCMSGRLATSTGYRDTAPTLMGSDQP
jgi:hypothetical protein